jgi:hypothetical protein
MIQLSKLRSSLLCWQHYASLLASVHACFVAISFRTRMYSDKASLRSAASIAVCPVAQPGRGSLG